MFSGDKITSLYIFKRISAGRRIKLNDVLLEAPVAEFSVACFSVSVRTLFFANSPFLNGVIVVCIMSRTECVG